MPVINSASMMIECIKQGFILSNKNLQLVLVRISVTIINIVSLFIFLGIPLVVAVAYMGMDIAQARELIPFMKNNPLEFFSKYIGLFFVLGLGLLMYLIFTSFLFLYVLGGTVGMLKNTVSGRDHKFSMSSFFSEGRNNFSRLFWLMSAEIFLFTCMLVFIALSAGITAAVMHGFAGDESTLMIFLKSFVMVLSVITGGLIFFGGFIFIIYSIVVSVVEGTKTADSMKKTYVFLKESPGAFLFYLILIIGVIAVNMLFMGMGFPLVVFPFLNMLVYFVNAVFQGYLAIVVWSALIAYYTKKTGQLRVSAVYEI